MKEDAKNDEPTLLLRRKHLAKLLGRSVPSIDRDSKAGLLPKPIRYAGILVGVRQEILDWIAAGLPVEAEWEKQKRSNGEVRA